MGGSAREWYATLEGDLVPGSPFELRLVMTKFGAPDVVVGYSIDVAAQ